MILLDNVRANALIEVARRRFDTDLTEAELRILRESASSDDPPEFEEGEPRPAVPS